MDTLQILTENKLFLVLNKPSGMVVNRAESVRTVTVTDLVEQSGLISLTPEVDSPEYDEFRMRVGIVHRLDKDTSGVLVVARTQESYTHLKRQFMERKVKKTYLAIVHGRLAPSEGTVVAPIARLPWNRERFGIVPDGKEAVTSYRSLGEFELDREPYTLCRIEPQTGRTHQIRVHMKHINHPLMGDLWYTGRKTGNRDKLLTARIMLHAYRIVFNRPDTAISLTVTAPVPEDMLRVLKLGKLNLQLS